MPSRQYDVKRRTGALLRWRVPALMLVLGCAASNALALGPLGGGSILGGRLPGAPLNDLRDLNDPRLRDGIDAAGLRTGADPVATLQGLRVRATATLLRQHRDTLEADPQGAPVRRHQVLAWSPSAAARLAAQQHGFTILEQRELGVLHETLILFSVPDQLSTDRALELLRTLDPQGDYDFNHLYFGSGTSAHDAHRGTADSPSVALHPATGASAPVRMGLVDSGVAAAHPALRGVAVRQWGCGDKPVPSSHGTAVASLMLGHDGKFHGVAPNAQLYAADVYCGVATGGSADQIAAALAWMAGQEVGVINLSLVGPANRTLEKIVGAMLRRGHILTAAVGNDGPGAPPLYPASYPGVVGVTGVDPRQRPLPEAARGPQVMFAAPGSEMLAAQTEGAPYQAVRGTSFAAPLVAALLAEQLPHPDVQQARAALTALTAQAQRQNQSIQRTDALGWGVVGAAFRVAPGALD